jgi:hypothetical protein
MKRSEEIMEILEAFDMTGSLRGAAALVGCDHKTVAHWVRAREEAGGGLPVASRERPRVGPFVGKIEEWVERSRGRIRADKAHERLVVMGYTGSERTTRRAVARAKRAWRAGHGRVTRPWITEPGLWCLCRKPHSSHYAARGIMRRGAFRMASWLVKPRLRGSPAPHIHRLSRKAMI